MLEERGLRAGAVEGPLKDAKHGLLVVAHGQAAGRVVGRLHRNPRALIPRKRAAEDAQDIIRRPWRRPCLLSQGGRRAGRERRDEDESTQSRLEPHAVYGNKLGPPWQLVGH